MIRTLLTWCAVVALAPACGASTAAKDAGAPPPTWHADIQPLVARQCLGCHAKGDIAPNPLDTYADARPQADLMAADVKARRMPVWKPDPACGGPFVGERVLTQAQIDLFDAWARAGAPEGNPADAPAALDAGVQGLPHVDAELVMPEAYTPSATLRDDYRCFLVDPKLAAPAQVTGYDISPGERAEVHHVILYVVDRAEAQARDAAEPGAGWTCFGGAGLANASALGAWAPGMPAVTYPAGTGIKLETSKVLAVQVHYNMDAGVRRPDLTRAKLMYAQTPVTNAYLVPLVDDGFSVPPHAMNYTPPNHPKAFPNDYGVPLRIFGFLPHLHQMGKRITVTGPGEACLVDIPAWDFHWQQQYFRRTPVTVLPGEALRLTCTWDNTSDRELHWGEGTSDEMCLSFIYATPG